LKPSIYKIVVERVNYTAKDSGQVSINFVPFVTLGIEEAGPFWQIGERARADFERLSELAGISVAASFAITLLVGA